MNLWICIALLTVFGIAVLFGRSMLRRIKPLRAVQEWWARRAERGVTRCAKCGYSLVGLEFPRCPECGALRGFTVPLHKLGLTEQEIRDGFARRREERDSTTDDSEKDP